MEQQMSEIDTPIRQQHQRHSNYFNVHYDSAVSSSPGSRSRQSKNNFRRYLLAGFTDVSNCGELESQHNSQSSEQVDYGTQPDKRMEEYYDYDWDKDRNIKYRYLNGKCFFKRLII